MTVYATWLVKNRASVPHALTKSLPNLPNCQPQSLANKFPFSRVLPTNVAMGKQRISYRKKASVMDR